MELDWPLLGSYDASGVGPPVRLVGGARSAIHSRGPVRRTRRSDGDPVPGPSVRAQNFSARAGVSPRCRHDARARDRGHDGDLQHAECRAPQAAALSAAGESLQHPDCLDGRARDDGHAVEWRNLPSEWDDGIDPSSGGDAGDDSHVAAPGWYAAARQDLRCHRRLLRGIRAAHDARRLQTRELRAACASASTCSRCAGAGGASPRATRRRHLVSRVAGPVSRRPCNRWQADPVRGSGNDDCRCGATRLRYAARRRLLVQPATRQGRHQSFLRRIHAAEAGRDAAARERGNGADHEGTGARLSAGGPESHLRHQAARRIRRW
jgi:hypothetical protein